MDATLVSRWTGLCQELDDAFTAPSSVTFLHLITGWTLCRGRAVVTNFICTIGASLLGRSAKHWTSYEKFFYRAAWRMQEVSRLLLRRVIEPLLKELGRDGTIQNQDGAPGDGTIELLIDDTTAGRTGKNIAFAGYFKDASVSNTLAKVVHWSHNWVIGAIIVRPSRWPGWVLGLPVLAALYRKKAQCGASDPFQTRQQLAGRLIHQTHAALPDRKIVVIADGQYATREVAGACFEVGGVLISRLRSDSALFTLPPRRGKRRGTSRKRRGRRLATPKKLSQRKHGWQTVELILHGRTVTRQVRCVTCLWWHVAKDHPIKLVIVKNPSGKGRDDHLFSTDPTMSQEQIIQHFAARWPIEECIRDAKQFDGFEQTQGRCRRTVLKQAPLALVKQTLVKIWFLRFGQQARYSAARPTPRPWQSPKSHPSYRDMLATLRRAVWRARLGSINSAQTRRVRDAFKALQFAACDAA